MYRRIRHRRKSATTNYKKRVATLKGGADRLVVRKSNKAVTLQIIRYEEKGDIVECTANSGELKKMGWQPRCNIPTAYLTGLLLATKLKDRKRDFVLDIGLYRPVKGSVVFAAAKGFKDSGANLHSGIEFDEARLSGTHISSYAKAIDENEYKSRFSSYIKEGFDVKSLESRFESVKKELMKK